MTPLAVINRVLGALRTRKRTRIVGAEGGYRGLLLAQAMVDDSAEGPVFYIAPDEGVGRTVAADIAFFAGLGDRDVDGGGEILVVPEIDTSPYGDASADPRTVGLRLAALSRLRAGEPRLVVSSLRSLMRLVMPPSAFEGLCTQWAVGDEVEREHALRLLVDAGYRRVDVVEDPGTYAVRGGVMDVFVPRLRFPTRLEFFGDEVERMRLFDPSSQRSLREVESLTLHPVRETISTALEDVRATVLAVGDEVEAPSSTTRQVIENLERGLDFFGIEALTPIFHEPMVPLWEYLPASTRWYVDDPGALLGLAERLQLEHQHRYDRAVEHNRVVVGPDRFYLSTPALRERVDAIAVVGERLDLYEPDRDDRRSPVRVHLEQNLELQGRLQRARAEKGAEILRPVVEHLRGLGQQLDAYGEVVDQQPWDVVLVAPNRTHAERLAALLRGYGLRPEALVNEEVPGPVELGPAGLSETRIRVAPGRLSRGFASSEDRVLVLSEAEIFGQTTRKTRKSRRRAGVATLGQLSVGDYVVHMVHGIGQYQSLTKLALRGVPADYVMVMYTGGDKLYLPVHRIGEIERYAASDGKAPKLDKMGGTTFAAKTKKVKSDVRQMAEELLQIYAQRAALDGHAYALPGESYGEFEATFPFEETPDQADAIDAVQDDLGKGLPMDRLICGDVGFGKTEVALRAAFRVALGGKQVAVLAPTTVLVQQHFMTFSDRMSHFGVEVGCLNRFQSPKKRKATIDKIRNGSVDVVVGTHRILSRDVRFKDLGLVVIDEEQRFGVAQKERFKKLKTKLDVLTLTATPIPRTLHMSLLGMREISMITTPPIDRLAVRTYITRHGDQVIEDGVRAELSRGGQVFYVVPRIQGIEEHANRVRELVPEARVLVAHGQMPAEMLERTMVDFVEHRADVLVSTTIVESGLDIPRANTMFIARADQFGMAQLYQLRGRIGRSRLRAFCFLMVQSLERLSDDSKRRLEAIQRHSELGSGFNVASQDLEIRGAGDLLGKRQSGSIAAIGFEAYARILGEAVAELRGEPISSEFDPELAFDVAAFLPDDYVDDTGARLDFYRRLATARDVDEVHEVMEELHDRYGELPIEARHYGMLMVCKVYGRRLQAQSIELVGERFSVRLGPDTPLDVRTAAKLDDLTDGALRLGGPDRVVCTVPMRTGVDCQTQLRACEQALARLLALATSRPSGPS